MNVLSDVHVCCGDVHDCMIIMLLSDTQCDKKVLRLIFVWRNAWRDLWSTTGKK